MNTQKIIQKMARLGVVVLAVTAVVPAAVQAQDARALPFEGCWSPGEGTGPELCVRQTSQGLAMERSGGAEAVTEIVPIGTQRSVERDDCSGLETARFSADGSRILMRTEYSCAGGLTRVETGLISLPDHRELLDIRSVQMGDETVAWVQYYRLDEASPPAGISPLTWEVSRRSAANSVSIDDVPDALDMVDAKAVEAWLAETGAPLDGLDAGALVALSEQGVPASVIDIMVAVSHPDRFALAVDGYDPVVKEKAGETRSALHTRPARWGSAWGFSPWNWGYNPWDWGYSPWGWGGFGFSPFNTGAFGFNGWAPGWGGWSGWGGGVVIVPSGGSARGESGRVVNGRGYSSGRRALPEAGTSDANSIQAPSTSGPQRLARPRARPAESAAPGSRSTPSRRARPSSESTGGSRAGPPPARGNSGGAVRSGGSSNRGGSASGRSARPRRSGGGD